MLNTIFTGDITILQIAIMVGTAIVLGVLNSLIFSFKNRQSKSFSLTLALLPMVSAVIIFMVNGNLGIGVAVAGAFTLVRFRSIKGTGRELIAIFESMALGLLLGMGYVALAAIVFVCFAALVILLTAVNFGGGKNIKSIRITIPEDLDYDGIFDDIFKKYVSDVRLEQIRTKNMGSLFEVSYSANFKDNFVPKAFIDEIRTRNGNMNVTVSTYDDRETM